MRRRLLPLLVIWGLLAMVLPATAATVHVTGPAGARLILDGTPVGTLPLAGDLEVPAGEHVLTATLPGMRDWQRSFQIERHDELRLRVRVIPLRRRDAVLGSLLLAGSGQRYEGRRRLGWILTGAELAGALTAVLAEISYQNHRDDYLAAMADYRVAVNQDEITRLRNLAAAEYQDMDDAASLRDAAVVVAVAAVAVSVLDAWWRFPALTAGEGVLPTPPLPDAEDGGPVNWPTSAGLHVGLRLAF